MAEKYFNAGGADNDVTLLPIRFRDAQELPDLADVVEQEIIAFYTRSTHFDPIWAHRETSWGTIIWSGPYAGAVKIADGLYVMLRGYAEDAALAELRFKDAMRREIAHVLRWRLPQGKREPGVESDSDGDRSTSFRDSADDRFPTSFPAHVGPFVVSEPVYTL